MSLLSVLLAAGAEPMDIWLAELAPGGEWDFAFWHYDPDDVMCAFHCPPSRSIWKPVETPIFTGQAKPYERPERKYQGKPWHGDPDPK